LVRECPNYVSARPKHPWGIYVPIANDDNSIWEIWPEIAKELYRISKPNVACFVFTRWDQWDTLKSLMSPWNIKNMIVWDKCNHTAGDLTGNFGFAYELICFSVKGKPKIRGRRIWNIWNVPRIPAGKLLHPSEKPVSLIQIAIRAMSSAGDLVFDSFIGSGTTAVAALKLDRHFYGCDISPEYVKLANKQIEKAQLEMAQTKMF